MAHKENMKQMRSQQESGSHVSEVRTSGLYNCPSGLTEIWEYFYTGKMVCYISTTCGLNIIITLEYKFRHLCVN